MLNMLNIKHKFISVSDDCNHTRRNFQLCITPGKAMMQTFVTYFCRHRA